MTKIINLLLQNGRTVYLNYFRSKQLYINYIKILDTLNFQYITQYIYIDMKIWKDG